MLTNKELSEKLNIPITKIRRNTKEFLGEDPVAKRRTGFKRQFTINEGFFVYLGGFLVSHLGMSFEGARNALEILKPWLLLNGLVPETPKNAIRLGADRRIKSSLTISLLPSAAGDRIQLFTISGVADFNRSSEIDSVGRSFSISEKTAIEYQYSVRAGEVIDVIDPTTEETVLRKEIPIMVLIENYTRLVMGDRSVGWFRNWELLAAKKPTAAENSIKKFVRAHGRYPSLSELLGILGIQFG